MGESGQTWTQHKTPTPAPTHTGGENTGGCLVKVEGADAAHAVGDQRQHIAVGGGGCE